MTADSHRLTFKYRVLPTRRQHAALASVCEGQRQLYNAALQERIDCYRKTGKALSYISQAMSLKAIRADDPDGYGAVPANLSRATLQRLHHAYDGFFRRVRAGAAPGFPRFKSKDRWHGFGFAEFSGIVFDNKRLRFKGLPGGLRVHLHRSLPAGKIAGCQFIRDGKGWSVCFQVAAPSSEKHGIASAVGIDVGLKAFAYQSDGVAIPAPQIARRAERSIRVRSRALARCKRGSVRRGKTKASLARAHLKIANTRRTWLHQLSARISRSYDLIAVEDLNVAGMVQNRHLSRSISDAGWRTFTDMLAYKAEKAGGTFIRVNPKMTSQECSGCGVIVRKGLADRVHNCPECGLVLDRDHNAALNILRRAVLSPQAGNVGGCAVRRPRSLKVATP
jgi:putative transposase